MRVLPPTGPGFFPLLGGKPRATLILTTLLLAPFGTGHASGPASAPTTAPTAGKAGPLPDGALAADGFTGSEKIAPPDADPLRDARWCRLCHDDDHFESSAWRTTAHTEQVCRDCHSGYHFNPHLPAELGPEAATTNEGATPAKRRAAAWATCQPCHKDAVPEEGIRHGLPEPGKPAAENPPTCRDCHGDPHEVLLSKSLPPVERRRKMNDRCVACHGDAERMKAAGLDDHVPAAYGHSVHGRKLDLGGERAPGCVDCHGSHETKDLKDPEVGRATCGECHEHATPDFVTLGDHRPFTLEARPVSFFTLKFFGWLTFLTIFALSMHVLLDVYRSVRVIMAANRNDDTPGGHA
ncbi:cytochrome c3 family protein [Myxococcota bacterium]|nr:cytochrome c3 family protein [Myxococcota bacterium]